MSVLETKARADLLAWIAEDPRTRTRAALGRAVGVSAVTVSGWCRGVFRPEPHHRDAIQIVTKGRVRTPDWLLPHEREGVAAVRPFGQRARASKSARTGTDG